MGYSVSLLGEQDGFDKRILFRSSFSEAEIKDRFEAFRKSCTGVAREHLPFRCPIRKLEEGSFELLMDDRNLSYNFDSLLRFLGEVVSSGSIKAVKVLDGGKVGASGYVITCGNAEKFECYPSSDHLAKIERGQLTFAELLKNNNGMSMREYIAALH